MDYCDLEIEKLYIYAMHHSVHMPRKVNTKYILAKAIIRIDKIVLQKFTKLCQPSKI